jgi:ribosomal protein S6--L-glutamate ligase
MKIGIISLGGKSSVLVAKECEKYFDEVHELNLKNFDVRLIDGDIKVTYDGEDFSNYDCLYIRGSHKYASIQRAITEQLNKHVYMPIAPKAFSIGHDKFLTSLILQKNNIPVPKTYYAADVKIAKNILEKVVSYPIILKVQSGTHGKGVLIAENLKTAKGILDILESFKQPFIIQEFVPTKDTSDIRVLISGKKVIASYLRIAADGDFRSNVHAGGKRQHCILTKEQEKLAIRTAKAIGADISGVDILNSKNPSVIEINLSPSLHSVSEVSCVNAVWEIAKELYNQTIKFHEKKEKRFRKKLQKKQKKNGNGHNNNKSSEDKKETEKNES